MSNIVKIIASFLAGLIGAMGFGGGGVLIIYLVIFASVSQLTAQGINLAFFIPCAIISVIIYTFKKEIKYKEIIPVIIGGVAGAIIGSLIIKIISTKYLSVIFAIFLILMGVTTFFQKDKTLDKNKDEK